MVKKYLLFDKIHFYSNNKQLHFRRFFHAWRSQIQALLQRTEGTTYCEVTALLMAQQSGTGIPTRLQKHSSIDRTCNTLLLYPAVVWHHTLSR